MGVDDGATLAAGWHGANPALEPKVAHLCHAAVLGWRATTVRSELIVTKQTFLQSTIGRLASSSASICASRHRIQASKRGPLIILVTLGDAQTMCQESILTVVIVALFGSGARSAGKEGPSP
jgi:hypothetical protein